jgi:sucrose-6-phosphate hydrolase SacC (GH32 family)
MNFPVVLTLGKTDEGIRMFTNPVREIEKLHKKKHSTSDEVLKPGKNPLSKIKGDLFDLRAEFAIEKAAEIGFDIRGVRKGYLMPRS